MTRLKKNVGKKAAKVTIRHTGRGLKSRARREPVRATALVGAGSAVGVLAGFVVGRKTG